MREDSVNWGNFMTYMRLFTTDPSRTASMAIIRMYHHLACAFPLRRPFEIKRVEPRTMPPLTVGANPLFTFHPDSWERGRRMAARPLDPA